MIDQLLQSFAAAAKSTEAKPAEAAPSTPAAAVEAVVPDPVVAAPPAAVPAQIVPVESSPECGECGGVHQWKIRSNAQWFCMVCQPPAVPSMVAAERGKPAEVSSLLADSFTPSDSRSVLARYHYAVGQPCPTCRGRLVRETCWSDFSADVTCWTCGKTRRGLYYDR